MILIFLIVLLFSTEPLTAVEPTPWLTPDEVELLEHPYRKDVKIESYYNFSKPPQEIAPLAVEEKKPTNANDYRLRIGDLLFVSLYGSSDLLKTSSPLAPNSPSIVDGTGNIIIPFVGSFYALGKTIDEFRRDMSEKVKKDFPNTLVSVTPNLLTGNQYTILGEVAAPGTWTTSGSTTILSALAQAGGFPIRNLNYYIIDYADLDKAFLFRNGEIVPVDFTKLVRQGDLSENLIIKGGDYIYVPNIIVKEVYVMGQVLRPTVYTFIEQATLMEVLSWSGGVTNDASSRALVIRGSICKPEVYWIDINLIGRGAEPDFLLARGDIVYVPAMKFTVAKQIIRLAISAFVNQLFTAAGQNAFVQLTPAAAGFGFANNNSGIIFTPVTAVSGP